MEDIKRMVTRPGFTAVLLERYQAAAANGKPQSKRAIFDDMEEEFENEYGRPLYWGFSGFRHYQDKLKLPQQFSFLYSQKDRRR